MAKQNTAPAAASAPPSPAPIDPGRPLVSGVQPAPKTLAPTLTESPKGMNPEKELAQRQREALAKLGKQGQQAEDAAAREAPATPPKAKTDSPSSEPATKSSASTSEPSKDSSDPSSSKPKPPAGETDSSAPETPAGGKTAERRPRIDLASFRKWAEEHPEEAAEIGKNVFKLPSADDWVGLQNKRRKVRGQIQEERAAQERANAEALAAIKAEREAMDAATGKLSPIADLWMAVAQVIKDNPGNDNPPIDFGAADAAFEENAGIPLDTYLRLRARRTLGGSPAEARLRVQNAKLQRDLEAAKPKAAEAPKDSKKEGSADDSAAAPAVPSKERKPQHDWSGEIDSRHKLRQIEGWQLKLDDEMRRFYDPDTGDYSEDPEEAAARVLKREIAALMPEDEAPAPKPKPKVAAKPAAAAAAAPKPKAPAPKEEPDPHESKLERSWDKNLRRAMERHQARMRGELAEEEA
jgi:hypothetical protein